MNFPAKPITLFLCVNPFSTFAAVVSPPPVLSLIASDVYVQYSGPGVANTLQHHPSVLSIAVGGSMASADFGSGVFKASSAAADTGSQTTYAYTGMTATFKNTGAVNISFAAGAIDADIDAVFSRTIGSEASGQAATVLSSALAGTYPGNNVPGVSVLYQYGASNSPSSPFFDFHFNPNAGFTGSGTADADKLSANLAFPAFTLKPNDILTVNYSLNTWVVAGVGLGTPGSGWSATSDATHTASISLQLPAGTLLNSPIALDWVKTAPVPLPPAIGLMLTGLAGIFGFTRQRSHQTMIFPLVESTNPGIQS
ncbi:hypothetical protein [Methylomonas sp. ZR1]|uniref:hypothetical protein n=1 Tax=Methylomonas sp. ZR1 TaxID=1797072 RepID=UPI0014918D8C|nr:hypothetical protein [Methylomonas sp. ZR1]NOV28365.1 hypothetical protein [Methylomonas sp. ZR1]